MTQACGACGEPVPATTYRRPRRWCSDRCRKRGYGRARDTAPAPFRLSRLNIKTTRRYEACKGRHVPSGLVVEREYIGRVRFMPVCLRCKVPIRAAGFAWNSKIAAGAA